jgi:endonuclease/exonuclease/phosphatase family metal-dependent hydrolase
VRQRWLHFLGVGGHLDHIFFKALEVVRAGIELRAAASDHYPVWAILRWPDQPGRPGATTQDAPR